jgi:drug/metabolite transporter (DMT)-like permease
MLTERVLENIQFTTLLTIELFFSFLVMFGLALTLKSLTTDLPVIFSSRQTAIFVILIVVAFNVANTCIVLSIESRNATLAGLIEISYPLFIGIFSWIFFRENNLNFGSAAGGVLVFVGVTLIYLFNR